MGLARTTPLEQEPSSLSLQVYLLGTVGFDALLRFQRRLHYEISGDRSQAALILCEHPPIITIGRHGSRAHILAEPAQLQSARLAGALAQSRRRLLAGTAGTGLRLCDFAFGLRSVSASMPSSAFRRHRGGLAPRFSNPARPSPWRRLGRRALACRHWLCDPRLGELFRHVPEYQSRP